MSDETNGPARKTFVGTLFLILWITIIVCVVAVNILRGQDLINLHKKLDSTDVKLNAAEKQRTENRDQILRAIKEK